MLLSRLLSLPATALSITATVASALAEVAQLAARQLTTDGSDAVEAVADTAEAIRQEVAGREQIAGPDQAAQLAQAATGLAELSDGAEAETARRGRAVPDGGEREGGAAPTAHVPKPVLPASRNPQAFDVERTTALPAKEVIAILEQLSSTELSEVYEHESANRRRKTVLRAVEQHVLPPDPTVERDTPRKAARAEAAADVVDVTRPSETVYSSETPA